MPPDSSRGDAPGPLRDFLQSQEDHDHFLPSEEVGTAALVGLAQAPTAALLNDGIGWGVSATPYLSQNAGGGG